jgi:glycerol-3-phosphate dehydrogenase
MMTRTDVVTALKGNPKVSVVIVGAGINGIGTFRDLALNGVDVLLIDRGDFCSGASAASSHMAHGGIRYLENGEFRLVHEAVQERNRLIRNAPHLVVPLPTTIPIFRMFSGLLNAPLKFLGLLDRPSERGSLVIKIGLMVYDVYTGSSGAVPRHRFLNRTASLASWGKLNPAVRNTATYFDGAILQPERLALELVLDAEADNANARAINYMSFARIAGSALVLRDETTGEDLAVEPRLVINATGPWIDMTNQGLGLPTHFIGGTKGSHLVLKHSELRAAIGDHEFFFENKDGRIVLIFPLYDRVLVGTSDIPIEDPDDARCTEEEVDYFLQMISRVFPAVKVRREDIVFRFSGVRPLAAGKSRTTGQITRDHEIQVLGLETGVLPCPAYSLIGGKWTSFRAFSEQVTDRALGFLQRPRRVDTRGLAIGGGKGYPRDPGARSQVINGIVARTGLPAERAEVLFGRYGTRCTDFATFMQGGADPSFVDLPQYSRREIGFIALHEKVVHLEDVLLRRSMLAMLGYLSRRAVEEIADAVGDSLRWDSRKRQQEVSRAIDRLRDAHQVAL